jgi:hypothetical protein
MDSQRRSNRIRLGLVMRTFDESKVGRVTDGADGGQFTAQQKSAPEIPDLSGPTFVMFDEKFTTVYNSARGATHFKDYEAALTAANGDVTKVWSILDSGYPEGIKIWEYLDAESASCTVWVEAENEEDADVLAVAALERDWDIGCTVDDLYSAGVFFGDKDEDYEDWVPAPDTAVFPGNQGDPLAFLVTKESWTAKDETAEYLWRSPRLSD